MCQEKQKDLVGTNFKIILKKKNKVGGFVLPNKQPY